MYQPFHTFNENQNSDFLILCDHASNLIPKCVIEGSLGISEENLNRHIAYDIGASGLSKELGKQLKSPVILSNFSRLVIDPNRGEDDPTLIMQLYDGTIIEGNRNISKNDRENRLNRCYRPYHNEINRLVSTQHDPILISIHSFTPKLKNGFNRPWHVGILSSNDRRFAQPLLNYFNNQQDVICGDNEPYRGDLIGDTMFRHALSVDRLHVLIEVRNDLISSEKEQLIWGAKLAHAINSVKQEIDR